VSLNSLNSLREYLADLIGAEIQVHDVELNGKTKKVTFRQISDAEGRTIFAPGPDGESDQDRGQRVMTGLIAASLCDDDGKPRSSFEEVAALQQVVKVALYEKAAITNNLQAGKSEEAPAQQGDQPPKG
jgi:hypothetical protein